MGDTKKENDNIMEFGQAILHADRRNTTIYLLSIIGEIEGHECLPSTSKTASGTPMEWLPPSTKETVGFESDATISAIASPLSTSPPMVLSNN